MISNKFLQILGVLSGFLFLVTSCSTPKEYTYFRTGEVLCVENDSRLVTVSSLHHGSSAAQAQMFAERNALENLLFKGIAGCYEVPIVADEQASIQTHKAFYDWLITGREYERYITDRTANPTSSSGGLVTINMTITFDVQALRKEMERQGVIKKFGI
jgi:hypothetical protein